MTRIASSFWNEFLHQISYLFIYFASYSPSKCYFIRDAELSPSQFVSQSDKKKKTAATQEPSSTFFNLGRLKCGVCKSHPYAAHGTASRTGVSLQPLAEESGPGESR